MVKTVMLMGESVLAERALPVPSHEFGGARLRALAADLWDTLAERGGIGLAAPQIGVPWRFICFGLPRTVRRPATCLEVPQTALVNPTIEVLDAKEEEDWEGCLSLPGLRGRVPRPKKIRYKGWDVDGHPVERTAEGWHARVVLHEFDHLDGILYPARIRDWKHFGFISALFPQERG